MSLCELSREREVSINTKKISIQPYNFLFLLNIGHPTAQPPSSSSSSWISIQQQFSFIPLHTHNYTYYFFLSERSSIFLCYSTASMLYLRLNVKECPLLLFSEIHWRKSSTNNRHLFSFYTGFEHWSLVWSGKKNHT